MSREGYLTEFSFMKTIIAWLTCKQIANLRAALYLETAAILSIESVIVVFSSIVVYEINR